MFNSVRSWITGNSHPIALAVRSRPQFKREKTSLLHRQLLRFSFPILVLVFTGCSPISPEPEPAPSSGYDANSWQEMIPAECQSFFDGCNQCNRTPGAAVAACTRRACVRYEKPRCLDDSAGAHNSLEYLCEGRSISVIHSGDNSNTVTGSAHTGGLTLREANDASARYLARVPSASGEKYRSDAMEFWSKGNQAMWIFGDTRLNCELQ